MLLKTKKPELFSRTFLYMIQYCWYYQNLNKVRIWGFEHQTCDIKIMTVLIVFFIDGVKLHKIFECCIFEIIKI